MLTQGTTFFLINTGRLEQHKIAGGYNKDGQIMYIFLPHGKVHTIAEAQVYTSKEAAEKEFTKRLKDSAQENIKAAEEIEKDGMEVTEIPQKEEETWLKAEK